MKKYKIVLEVETDATVEQLDEVAYQAYVQLETLEDEHKANVKWKCQNLLEVKEF